MMSTPPHASTTVPHWRPCLACGSGSKTNRPMSYHLRKGVRKHLSSGVGYRTATGANAVLPPLVDIRDDQCMCLSCAHMLDILLSSIDKLPLTNGKPLAVARAITRPNRRKRPPPPQPPPATAPQLPTIAVVAVPPLPNDSYIPTVPTDCCVVCHLAHQPNSLSAGAHENDLPTHHTLHELRHNVTNRVGNHLSTLESTVRIFRAARVELADDGICTFDSRTFAAVLAHGGDGRVCKLHFDELVRAADVKAAGALPCAICGDKPTLRGDDEVRLLTSLAAYCTASMAATVIELKQVPVTQQEHFCANFRRFLENEFACGNCYSRLDMVRQQTSQSS